MDDIPSIQVKSFGVYYRCFVKTWKINRVEIRQSIPFPKLSRKWARPAYAFVLIKEVTTQPCCLKVIGGLFVDLDQLQL